MWATSRVYCVPSQHFCHFLMWEANPELETNSSRNRRRPCFHIRNQSFLLLFVLVLHDVMATRQRSDELRVMDICIGTFPFPRQPLFTLNVLHIIHQYHPPGQFTSRPICAGAFFFHYSLFYSVSDWRKRIRALPPFRQKE